MKTSDRGKIKCIVKLSSLHTSLNGGKLKKNIICQRVCTGPVSSS